VEAVIGDALEGLTDKERAELTRGLSALEKLMIKLKEAL
jgi:hypothetical protein